MYDYGLWNEIQNVNVQPFPGAPFTIPASIPEMADGDASRFMLKGLIRGRTLTFGVSGLLHLGLIAAILLAEHWILSAHASRPPVLPVEIVTLADAPPPALEPVPEKARLKPVPPKITRLPKPVEVPLPKMVEALTEPPPDPKPVVPKPAVPEPPAETAPSAPAPVARESAPPAQPAGPAGSPGPPMAAVADPSSSSGLAPGVPGGRSGGPPSGPAVAAAPSRDTGSTGAITQNARPQGGYQVRPSYPSSARRLGIQGTTLLRVQVLIDGRVGDVIVQQSAGHPDLDQAAADAVRRWRFEPARRGNDPVAMWVLLPVEFQLK